MFYHFCPLNLYECLSTPDAALNDSSKIDFSTPQRDNIVQTVYIFEWCIYEGQMQITEQYVDIGQPFIEFFDLSSSFDIG